jgi:hypothetical protein
MKKTTISVITCQLLSPSSASLGGDHLQVLFGKNYGDDEPHHKPKQVLHMLWKLQNNRTQQADFSSWSVLREMHKKQIKMSFYCLQKFVLEAGVSETCLGSTSC